MNNDIQRQLDLLEFGINAANATNYKHLSDAVHRRLNAATDFVILDDQIRKMAQMVEDCTISLVVALSETEVQEIGLDAIRADALAELAHFRILLSNSSMRMSPDRNGDHTD